MSPKNRFTDAERQQMVAAIEQAELNTSGEIRVHIENRCKHEALDRATEVFADLKMHKTALRNGVLIYIALDDHKLAILGDAGINAVVPAGFWSKVKEEMVSSFKQGHIVDGICRAVNECGELLKKDFPYQDDDINELSDDISFNQN
ncbi:MAG: TPM domain-containing protein [Marinifilaceae bacterium]